LAVLAPLSGALPLEPAIPMKMSTINPSQNSVVLE